MNTLKVYAPGRAELLGNHTDYNEGFVLSIAIDYGTTIEGFTKPTPDLTLISQDPNERYSASLDHLEPSKDLKWPNYILGVIDELKKRNAKLGGAEFTISTTIPMGAGLSSSAALEVATAIFFQKAYPFELKDIEIAKVAQAAEHKFVGVKCGLLDQISSLMSKAGKVTFIDCRTYEVRHIPLPPDTVFFIVNSGVKHALVTGEYNERRHSCEEAARLLGAKALRDVTPDSLEAGKSKLPEQVYKRASHIVHENRRVQDAVKALEAGDVKKFGLLMFESHESSIRNFENSCPELDALVSIASKAPGCYGSRLSGGGFGGATIQLVEAAKADAFEAFVTSEYEKYSGRKPRILRTKANHGAL